SSAYLECALNRSLSLILAAFLGLINSTAIAQVNLVEMPWPTDLKDGSNRLRVEFLTNQYLTSAISPQQGESYQSVLPHYEFISQPGSNLLYGGSFSAVLPLNQEGESHYFFPQVY